MKILLPTITYNKYVLSLFLSLSFFSLSLTHTYTHKHTQTRTHTHTKRTTHVNNEASCHISQFNIFYSAPNEWMEMERIIKTEGRRRGDKRGKSK